MIETSAEAVVVADRLLRGVGLDFVRIVPMSPGREHHLFRVEFRDGTLRILKVPRGDAMADPYWPGRPARDALRAEREAIARVRNVDVPVPYHKLPTDPPAALMGIVPGVTPEDVYRRGLMDRPLLEAVSREMGRLLATIHEVRKPVGEATVIPLLGGVEPERARLLHMDFHLGNLLGSMRTGGRWIPGGVIDWTWAKWGPREADFTEMGVSVFIANPWALEPMLVGYRDVSGQQLEPSRIFPWVRAELERRLANEPPADEAMRALWLQRMDEWASGRFLGTEAR
jgi:aminoglycoside phosphotransferase (APT) family kinase protein